LTPKDALEVIPKLSHVYDEPFADVSQIPSYLVSKVARQHVTVALSGDGGDEFFCGYSRYMWWRQIWSLSRSLPKFARRGLRGTLKMIPARTWTKSLQALGALTPRSLREGVSGDRIHKVADLLNLETAEELYLSLISHWDRPDEIVIGGQEPHTVLREASHITDADQFTERMQLLDVLTYLPNDILVKVDRASMAVSLETRAPLLDHRLFEFATRLPLSFKLRGASGKAILRDILSKYVPHELFERPKSGFAVPIDAWLRGPLRDWAESLLDPVLLREQGYFEVEPVRRMWADYIDRNSPHHYHLWDILMFQSWLERERADLGAEQTFASRRVSL
jgi:asparagine synthase (glutamine-hydrolysing)